MPTEVEQIDLATAYIALSNSHKVDFIVAMFSDEAIYNSHHVGEFKGRSQIREMMSGFFSRYPDVRWTVPDIRSAGKSRVVFQFVMTAAEATSGNPIRRVGAEVIEFDQQGFIRYFEVNPAPDG